MLSDEELEQCAILILLLLNQNKKKKKRPRRFWVRNIYKNRKEYGLYHTLVRELRMGDREFYFK